MIGAIIGDIVGSRYEWHNIKTKKFEFIDPENCFFTDDSVMTCAVASALMKWKFEGGDLSEIALTELRRIGRKYPHSGYGGMFRIWLASENPRPYNSFGNGSAMRVSACGWVGESIEEVQELSAAVTEITHNHPEGLRGAEATAVCVFLARKGVPMEEIRKYVEENYYQLDFTLDEIRPTYRFDGSCQGTVPQALEAFFESTSYIDAVRNAISIGGDSDTMAAITGAVAEAYWGIPPRIADWARMKLKADLYDIVCEFKARYQVKEAK